MRNVCLVSVVVMLLVFVAGQAVAQPWPPQGPPRAPAATVPVEVIVDGCAKVTVVNSDLTLLVSRTPVWPDPWEPYPEDFVHLDIETNMDVVLDVYAPNKGRLRSDEGFWLKYDEEHGTSLRYMVCGGWADSPEEFLEYWYNGSPIPELGPGARWIPPGSGWGPPEEENHLYNHFTNEVGYRIPSGPDSRPVTLAGAAWFWDNAPDPVAPPVGVYRGELLITVAPAPPPVP